MTPGLDQLAVSQFLDFSDKTVVITGGVRGIGRACAERFAECGARLFIADICCPEPAEPPPGAFHQLDVTDAEAVLRLGKHVIAEAGRLDVWINSAGIFPRGGVLDITPAEWQRVMDVNVQGALVGAQVAARAMKQTGGGVILNVASSVAFRVIANAAHYRASKAALISLTQNLAAELGPFGIRSLAVCPTVTRTEGLAALTSGTEGLGLDRYVQRLPLGRAASVDDVARVALFAASPMAAFMTGSALLVDGGEIAT